jgi:hypothetical protein
MIATGVRRRRRKAANPSPPNPASIIAQVDGSGTAVSDTPSRRANGGRWAAGYPTARNDSASLVALAVKSKVSNVQPEKEPGVPAGFVFR